jgi:hypothetical protein
MSQKSLTQKLLIKPRHQVLLLNAPQGYADMLLPLPEGAAFSTTPGTNFDCVLAFVYNKADIDTHAETIVKSVNHDGLMWFAYPKKSSKVKTDITRDIGWESVRKLGMEAIAQVAIDDTWAATRFRPKDMVKRPRKA